MFKESMIVGLTGLFALLIVGSLIIFKIVEPDLALMIQFGIFVMTVIGILALNERTY